MSESEPGVKDLKHWLQKALGKNPDDLFIFGVREGVLFMRPKKFLGKDTFAKAATVVRELGGEYISAGKDSHFRFKRGEEKPPSKYADQAAKTNAVTKIRAALELIEEGLRLLEG